MKKLIAVLLVVVFWLSLLPVSVFASDWGTGDTLEDALSELKVAFDSTQLDWLMLPNIGVIKQRYTYYLYKNARTGQIEERPVYCIDPTRGGAYEIVAALGPNSDGSKTATYIRGERVGDAKYIAIMGAGYPHQKLEAYNLQTRDEGYYATKVALWAYIRGNDITKITINPAYGNSDPVALRVRDATAAIYNNAMKASAARVPRLTLAGKPSATAQLDSSGQYYVQGVEVYASGWIGNSSDKCGDVQLSWDSPPPTGTIVLGTNDEDITSALNVTVSNTGTGYFGKVTIKYPANVIDESFSPPTLNAEATVPNNDIYVAYAKAGRNRYQRYLVERDPKIPLSASFLSQFSFEPAQNFPTDSGLRIRKLQSGTNIPLEGAVFDIRDPEGKLLYSMATDASGIIDIPIGVAGNYTVTEKTPPQYHLPAREQTQSVYVNYGEVGEVTFANEPYGTLRVTKRDAANGTPLGGASIRLKNITTNATQESITDSSGSAVFELLPVGAYEIVELSAPDGYNLDSTVHTVNVLPLSQGETSYALTNEARPGLRIIKFDRQTMTPIAGVSFEIWQDGNLYGTYQTDAWGEIELRDLTPGTYTAKEVATVSPYVLDTTAQWIELSAGQRYISELVFFNLQKPGISLVKIDSETYEPLPNARYLVKKVGDAFAKEYTTDENGEINLSELDPGAYTVEELAAPSGWLIDDSIRTIQINGGENAQFVFTDTKRPVIEIVKYDGTNFLPGATFRIAKIEDGSHYLDRITDTSGRIRIEDMDPGIYSVKELQPPPSYLPNDTEYHVELFPGRTSQLVVNNIRKPDLQIVKTDANTGEPIEGVTYTVKKVDSSTLETVKTDADGEAWVYLLDEGVYQVTEQSVPPTHILDTTPQLITLVGGRTGVVRFQNFPKPKLRILKVDVITGEPLPNAEFRVSKAEGGTVSEYITDESGEILVENLDVSIYEAVEFMPPDGYILYNMSKQIQLEPGKTSILKFDNIRKPTLIITKSNAMTYEPIPNTIYKIEYEDESGGIHNFGNHKTDENGQIVLPQINAGWFIITEVQAAPGYSLAANPVTRKFLAPGENAYTNAATVPGAGGDIGGLNVKVASGADFVRGTEILDYPLNSIVIRKTSAVTGELLAGAVFEVRQVSESVSGTSGTLIGRYTTDHSGTIVISGLKPGGFIVEEVKSPPNYLLSENSQQQVWLKPDGTSIAEITFANWPHGGLLITKVDAQTNKPLAGARFKVTDSDGAVVGSSNGEFVTDMNGEIMIPNLKPGAFVVREIEAPPNYAIDTAPQTVDVGLDGKVYTVRFTNTPLGGLLIRKVSSTTGLPLTGAVFKVTDSRGTVIGTANGEFTTGKDGTIHIPGLKPGTFVVTELRAPSGFNLDPVPKTIEVRDEKQYTLTVENTPQPGFQLLKIDEETRRPISGVEFALSKQNGERIGTYRTDSQGLIRIPSLESGWYSAVEVKAGSGYRLDASSHSFEIKDGENTAITVTNRKASAILIHKIDSVSGKGIYGVQFLLMDANRNPLTTLESDQNGYVYLPDISDGKYHLRELEAEGYILDDQIKTFYVEYGSTKEIIWKNTPVLAQIQVIKYSSDYNPVTGTPAGSLLKDAVFEVSKARNGEVVCYITTDARGVAASPPLPLTRYFVKEVTAPPYYQISGERMEAELEYAGQIVKLSVYNKSALLGTAIKKVGNLEVVAGDTMRYDISLSNNSNVPLSNFFWQDRIPTDASRAQTLSTGTYNERLYYRALYRTNYSEWRVLQSNLLTTNNYSFNLTANALGLMNGEAVTEVKLEFGTVSAGFASVTKPIITVLTLPTLSNGYQITNRCEVGGQYQGAWQNSTAVWITKVIRFGPVPPLPKTGN